jgi:hypothetical protein
MIEFAAVITVSASTISGTDRVSTSANSGNAQTTASSAPATKVCLRPRPTTISTALVRYAMRRPQGEERLLGHGDGEDQERELRQQDARGEAELREAAVAGAPLRRGVLHGHEDRARPLPADARTLHEAEHDQEDRRPDADRVVGGDQPDRRGRDARHRQRRHEHGLAADAVAEVPHDDPADRPGDEPDGERAERAGELGELGEELAAEDQGRRDPRRCRSRTPLSSCRCSWPGPRSRPSASGAGVAAPMCCRPWTGSRTSWLLDG